MRKLFMLAFLCLQALIVSADVVKGRVVDADSGEPLGDAGYISDMMNRNRFTIDASVTWKMLKSKGQLTLAARDLLNQMDRVYSNITPNMRTENCTETFHRYIVLSFTYNFDAKAKKDRR